MTGYRERLSIQLSIINGKELLKGWPHSKQHGCNFVAGFSDTIYQGRLKHDKVTELKPYNRKSNEVMMKIDWNKGQLYLPHPFTSGEFVELPKPENDQQL